MDLPCRIKALAINQSINPPPPPRLLLLQKLQAVGCVVCGTATNPDEAARLAEAGVDMIVAQGTGRGTGNRPGGQAWATAGDGDRPRRRAGVQAKRPGHRARAGARAGAMALLVLGF